MSAATVDRRHPERPLARIATRPPCRECGHDRPAEHHDRDAGDITIARATELGYCPELARRRGSR